MMTSTIISIADMAQGYIEAALWADCMCACGTGDCDCESGGRTHLEVSAEDREYVTILCGLFVERFQSDCEAYVQQMGDWRGPTDSLGNSHYTASNRLGHDLRMTSGGHGVGFWDRGSEGLDREVGERLSAACGFRTVFSREGGGDVWDAGDGTARFDHWSLTDA